MAARKALSSASGLSFSSWLRSAIQPSPMASVMTLASGGFASSRKRRCVTPLVLLLNRSGNSSAKSGTTVFFSRSVWMAATPLVLCEPTMAILAMRTFLGSPSSMRLTRATRASSPGNLRAHVVEEAPVDFVDDLKLAGQHGLEPGERPFLQRLGQQRVIGVGQRPPREVPGVVPGRVSPRRAGGASAPARRAWDACR